jgi:hypothetical protein
LDGCWGLGALGAAVLAAGLLAATGAGAQETPGYLDISSAQIIENSRAQRILDRKIRFVIEVAGPVDCAATPANYGFLIDGDKSTATGVTDAAFSELGVDARATVSCDPGTGLPASSIGPVTIKAVPAGTRITIETTAGMLPSADFNWIAYSQEGTRFFRLQDPGSSHWALHEILLD